MTNVKGSQSPALGPKQTCASALHMSAFGGKADITFCGNPLSRSLLGAKRTCRFALHMSANDPQRTFVLHCRMSVFGDKAYIKWAIQVSKRIAAPENCLGQGPTW
jgi:hypothetical protein